MSERVALIGVGTMGEALLSGLLRAGWPADSIVVADASDARTADMTTRYAVTAASAADAAGGADTVLLAVKPPDFATVLAELAGVLRPGQLVVSVAAGITTEFCERRLPDGVAVVRVMPNTPALVGAGVSAVAAGAHAEAGHLDRIEALLRPVGAVLRVPESQLDAVTAVSGSGPAYIFLVVEAMIDAAVGLGLARPVATELVITTLSGAAGMLTETGTHPTMLRENVTSPGGTTSSAVRELERHGVRTAVSAAVEAARDRSRELAAGQ